MTDSFDLLPFEPGDDSQAAFVYDTFRKSTDHWPWCEMHRGRLMDRLRHELAAPGTTVRIATPGGMPGSFIGWYAARAPDTIVYGFTRYSMRRQGVATAAFERMGVRVGPGALVPVIFWSPACARLAGLGLPIYFDVRAAYDERARL